MHWSFSNINHNVTINNSFIRFNFTTPMNFTDITDIAIEFVV